MKSIITDFGAVGDGVTDDTAAFQAAINTGEEIYIDVPSVGYVITTQLSINNSVSLVGSRNKSTILTSVNGYLFNINSSDVNISGLKVLGNAAQTNSLAVINTNTGSKERIRIENIDGLNLQNGIVDGGAPGIVITLNINDVMLRLHKGYGYYFTRVFAFLFLDNVTIDSVGVNNTVSKGIISNNEGCYLSRVFFLGNTPSNSGQNGFYFENSKAIHLSDTHADTLGGIAYYFRNCEFVQADHITAGLMNNHGLYLYNTTKAQFSNVYVQGRTGVAPTAPGCNGIFCDTGCDRVIIDNYITRLNSGTNIYNNPANTNMVFTSGITT